MELARDRGLAGMYSEVTAAHPYTLELCELRGTLADPPARAEPPERTDLHVEVAEPL